MMSSESSTDRPSGGDSGIQPWHFYFILAMGGATWAVVASRHTHPAALLMLSAAILAAGVAGAAMHNALMGFFGLAVEERRRISDHVREDLEREKALVLRSIKELEFDHDMKKLSDADFAEMSTRLRTRALSIMDELEVGTRAAAAAAGDRPAAPAADCPSCHTVNDRDARFCKSCGTRLT